MKLMHSHQLNPLLRRMIADPTEQYTLHSTVLDAGGVPGLTANGQSRPTVATGSVQTTSKKIN